MVDYELIALPRSCTIPETSSASLRNTMIYNVSGYTTTVCIYIYRRVRVCIGAYSISFCARTHKYLYTHIKRTLHVYTKLYHYISLHVCGTLRLACENPRHQIMGSTTLARSCSWLSILVHPPKEGIRSTSEAGQLQQPSWHAKIANLSYENRTFKPQKQDIFTHAELHLGFRWCPLQI